MGAHEDTWWPIDGPSRDGRMVWPPHQPAHRADDTEGVAPAEDRQ